MTETTDPAALAGKPLLTVTEAAAYLSLSRALTYRLIRRKEIASYRLTADAVRVRRVDLDAWVATKRVVEDDLADMELDMESDLEPEQKIFKKIA